MKHFFLLILLCILTTSVNAWEWKGIKGGMPYEDVTQILGKAKSIESSTDKSSYSIYEYVVATYSYQGYVLLITFWRTHDVEIISDFSFEKYNSSLPFTVQALIIQSGKNNLTKNDIHTQFGNAMKSGRHIRLGLREEFSNGAIVDYSYLDDSTVLEIKYGYTK